MGGFSHTLLGYEIFLLTLLGGALAFIAGGVGLPLLLDGIRFRARCAGFVITLFGIFGCISFWSLGLYGDVFGVWYGDFFRVLLGS